MNRTAWIFLCITLALNIGCHSSKRNGLVTEPNLPQENIIINSEKPVLESEPNRLQEHMTYLLSGSLGVEHATLKGLPGDPNTLSNGTYNVVVDANWSGTVTPEKEGFLFFPSSRTYGPFVKDVLHEIYVPQAVQVEDRMVGQNPSDPEAQALTGTLYLGGSPVHGVVLRTLASSVVAITDANGFFSLPVPPDWSGSLQLHAPSRVPDKAPQETPVSVCEIVLKATTTNSDCNAVSATCQPTLSVPEPNDLIIFLGGSGLTPKDKAELSSDLKAMSQWLSEQAFGISLVKRDPKSEPKAIYLPDDGVLFEICIEWPLADQWKEPNQPQPTSQWQAADQFIQHQTYSEDPQEMLHQVKTQTFLKKMTHSLVRASRIRHLDDDSNVTLHIWGPPPSKEVMVRAKISAIKAYAGAVINDEAFEGRVTLKLH